MLAAARLIRMHAEPVARAQVPAALRPVARHSILGLSGPELRIRARSGTVMSVAKMIWRTVACTAPIARIESLALGVTIEQALAAQRKPVVRTVPTAIPAEPLCQLSVNLAMRAHRTRISTGSEVGGQVTSGAKVIL